MQLRDQDTAGRTQDHAIRVNVNTPSLPSRSRCLLKLNSVCVENFYPCHLIKLALETFVFVLLNIISFFSFFFCFKKLIELKRL